MDSRLWDRFDTGVKHPDASYLDRGELKMSPLCNYCMQEVIISLDHEYCHLDIPKPKVYDDYVAETDYSRLLKKYGQPADAKVPSNRKRGR